MPRGIERCPDCGTTHIIRVDQYDCLACKRCVKWLGEKCSDPKCDFCSIQPPTPKGVWWDDPLNTRY